jgi:DNA polymerase-3 subunit epsilon
VQADSLVLSSAVTRLVARLRDETGVREVALSLDGTGSQGRLEVAWRGDTPSPAALAAWLDEPVDGETATGPDGAPAVGVLLPLAGEPGAGHVVPRLPLADSRPEFYDFDLFTAGPQAPDWRDRRLDELSFTVLDTETTGLDVTAGDRVVSIGAVRVVNGRVLRQEVFERLVQPGREVPEASTAIHGITTEMLRGAPALDDVLPAFARFAEETVLVGHNVGFDLRFLEAGAAAPGGLRSQPVLDTLLLDVALNPDHDEHTLDAIAARLGISVFGRHTALGDALMTADVLVGQLALLRGRGVRTLGEALALTRGTLRARVDEATYGL